MEASRTGSGGYLRARQARDLLEHRTQLHRPLREAGRLLDRRDEERAERRNQARAGGFIVSLEIARKVARIIEEITRRRRLRAASTTSTRTSSKPLRTLPRGRAHRAGRRHRHRLCACLRRCGWIVAGGGGRRGGRREGRRGGSTGQRVAMPQLPRARVADRREQEGKVLASGAVRLQCELLLQGLPRDMEYCNLCVRYFAKYHKQRSRKTEVARGKGGKRRRSDEAGTPAKQACLAPALGTLSTRRLSISIHEPPGACFSEFALYARALARAHCRSATPVYPVAVHTAALASSLYGRYRARGSRYALSR